MNSIRYIFSIKKFKFINNFIELQKHLPEKRKLQYLTIFLITVLCAFFETIAVTSSVPFISFLTNELLGEIQQRGRQYSKINPPLF